jgi:CRP-like cAMP-binding protein
MDQSSRSQAPTSVERHYAVTEFAETWHLTADKVRDLSEEEPGVLVIGQRRARRKRRYITLRIPQSVLERVHARLLRRACTE